MTGRPLLFAVHPRHLWKIELALLAASLGAEAIGSHDLALMFGAAAVTLVTVGERRDGHDDTSTRPELPHARKRTRTPPRGLAIGPGADFTCSRCQVRVLAVRSDHGGVCEGCRLSLPLPPGKGA